MQKLNLGKRSGEELLQTIEPRGIADELMRQTVEILLNLVEQLKAEVKELQPIEGLRDTIAALGKPVFKEGFI